MRFLDVLTGNDASELCHQAVHHVAVIFGFVGFGIGEKSQFDEFGIGQEIEREEVGTVAIAAGIGATYRIGVNLPPATANCGNAAGDYGVSLIEPTRYNPSRASYYMVMSGGVKYVARDMFIDGGVFHSFESKCSREPWQGEVRLGFGVRYHGIDYYAGAMYRSPTFDKQNRETLLGVVDISWNW